MTLISSFSPNDLTIHSTNSDGYNVFPPDTKNGVLDSHLHENKAHGTPLFPFASYEATNPTGSLFVPSHWHQEIEIICFFKGTASVHLNGKEFVVGNGDIVFVNQNELHQITSDATDLFYNAFVFRLDSLCFSSQDHIQTNYLTPLCEGRLFFPHVLPHDTSEARAVLNAFIEVIKMINKRGPGFQLMIKVNLLQIIGLLIDNEQLHKGTLSDTQTYSEKEEQLKKIMTYIHNHCDHKMYLDDIAGIFHMSPKYFSRYFKKHFGYTFVEYVNRLRIEKATNLLAGTDKQIMEICFDTGFENFSYFIRKFKEITGFTPAAYRAFVEQNKNI